MDVISEWVSIIQEHPVVLRWTIAFGSVFLALVLHVVFKQLVSLITGKTASTLDDRIVAAVRAAVVPSAVLVGIGWAVFGSGLPRLAEYLLKGTIFTIVALLWTFAAAKVGRILLEAISENVDAIKAIEPKTLPLFRMILTVLIVGGFLYAFCLAWAIPLASWLTSAGIVGIAVGFAAKDTLSNLFSGVFIVADTPYQVGDFVVLDNRIRGEVLEIGMRSTRLTTRDDVEVTVPNAVIANAQIINETGGPHEKMRVRVKVSAAYGSDVDLVRDVLMSCVSGVEHVCGNPAPRVRFRSFGDSGLMFELLAWIEEPVYRGRVLDELNRRVYKAFAIEGIEIPYAKHDVYIKEAPSTLSTP